MPKCEDAIDLLYDGREFREFRAPRLETRNTHGTGCTFASAIAAGLAQGLPVVDAVSQAKFFLSNVLKASARFSLGHGHGPLHHLALLHPTQ